MRAGTAAVSALLIFACSSSVRADQRRDFMFEAPQLGDTLTLDYFGTGGQLTLDHRGSIYGEANDYTAGVSTLVGYPLGQVVGYANIRVLFLELGGSLAYRAVWRNLSFDPGPNGEYCTACDRAARRDIDPVLGRGGTDTDRYMFAEAKATLYAPLNDYVVFTSHVAARYEDSRDRSYDWFFTSVHDGGVISRWESNLFFKHRDWGGIAPYVQLMYLPRGGHHESEWAYGFNAVTRLGLVARDDLLLLTFLIRPGDDSYGQHAYFSPVRALLIYRLILSL